LRQLLGLRPAPEFEAWLDEMRIARGGTLLLPINPQHRLLGAVGKASS
jgi:ethanolamine ammonia-lyase large subunit